MSLKSSLSPKTDAFFHVYNRGNNKGLIFFLEKNYYFLLEKINKYYQRNELLILCYCFMPNHYHFLIKQLIPFAISRFIGSIFNSYSKAINKQEGRTGTLFEGDFKLKYIDQESYLILLSRYIHLNPVIANLVSKPEEWPFSSYRDYIGLRKGTIPETNIILDYFDSIEEYKKFVEDYKPEDKNIIKPYLFE